jgi:hypothetical protein
MQQVVDAWKAIQYAELLMDPLAQVLASSYTSCWIIRLAVEVLFDLLFLPVGKFPLVTSSS